MRLAIGTAQFGLAYGVANQRGRVPADEAAVILAEARAAGCDTLDTAADYGDAEAVLGRIGVEAWKVVTKLPAVPDAERDVHGWVERTVDSSLGRLRLPAVYGLLLHRPAQLMGPQGQALAEALRRVREDGRAAHIGVSVYGPGELEAVDAILPSDLAQAPLNPLDRRWEESGWLARLTACGVECHARSAFLQGLLVMGRERRPAWTASFADAFSAFDQWVASSGVSPVQACLQFVLSRPAVDRLVVGVDGLAQLREVLAGVAVGPLLPEPPFGTGPDALISPVAWPRQA